ncbi:hypothetical protein BB934_43150 (plasmid) [Microvirga ossetica]|uniref:Uncharacterized protein n=1 Tax=Microvirga ossetica TaxID=1882682 RepID=A0A1B2EYM4_9HYPH|nr:hypothetical protein BB934_43150 [Microvirga ossetica]
MLDLGHSTQINVGAEQHGGKHSDPARPTSPKHRGAWPYGLAEALKGHSPRLVEAVISRLKRVIGNALRSRTDRRRTTEIAINALSRMLELGRPKPVRIV